MFNVNKIAKLITKPNDNLTKIKIHKPKPKQYKLIVR
jgi:hypothetical protein